MSTRDPSWRRGRTLLRYGVAVTAVLVALLLTRVLASSVESFRTPLFFCAVMLRTWFGGFRPGMVATLLSVLALKYDSVAPLSSWSFDIRDVPLFGIFSVSALLISGVIAKQQRCRGTRCRHRTRSADGGPDLRRLLDHQARGDGHGAVDQPHDSRGARWPVVGHPARRSRCDVSVDPAHARRTCVMTEAAATVSAVDDDPSLREALQSLIRSIGLRVATFGST
jgi:hypothetical protein